MSSVLKKAAKLNLSLSLLNLALFCGIHEKYAMWKFIVDVVHDFVSSLQPDVGRGFLHVSNVFLFHFSCFCIASPFSV